MASSLVEGFMARARYEQGHGTDRQWDYFLVAINLGRQTTERLLQGVKEEPDLADEIGAQVHKESSPDGEITVVQTPFYEVNERGILAAIRGKILPRPGREPQAKEYGLMLRPATTPYAIVEPSAVKAIQYPFYGDIHTAGYNHAADLEVAMFMNDVATGLQNTMENRVAA